MELILPAQAPLRKNLRSFKDMRQVYSFAREHVKNHRLQEFTQTWSAIEGAAKVNINEHFFMREYLWCVHVAGFSAKIVGAKYNQLLKAHLIIDEYGQPYTPTLRELTTPDYSRRALSLIGNRLKCKAIQETRLRILQMGWPTFYNQFVDGRDPHKLQSLPFMGPALSCHLARNLGNTKVCKPDVHLMRLAKHYGYPDVQTMCESLGSPAGKVDLILWYACADHGTR